MTNKEAIKIINDMTNYKPWEVEALALAIKALEHYELSGRQIERSYEMEYTDGYNQGWKDGRKALEQQPCEDCISREETLKYSHIEYDDDGVGHRVIYIEDIEELPPVQPQQKVGKWIDAVLPNDNGGLPVQVCNQCNTFIPLSYTGGGHNYCPSCGSRMVEPQESEDKE